MEALAITGIGLRTSLGLGVEASWTSLRAGECGLRPLRGLTFADRPDARGGEVPDAEPEPEDRRDRAHAHLLAACREALASAGIAGGRVPAPERAGLLLGSTLAAQASAPAFWESYVERGPRDADFRALKSYDAELRIADLCAQLDVRGEACLVSSACAAGASALAAAADLLRLGRLDLAVVAGWDALDAHTYAGFGAIKALSPTTPRPFAPDRDGMLLGDGFAALILERAESPRRPLARLVGYGESSDAYHLTKPHPEGEGAALAMQRALAAAGLEPAAIDAINLHCTSTPSNDLAEVRAMRAVFGDALGHTPLTACKPAVGHTLGGAGAVEAIVALLSLRSACLPPSLGVGELDEGCGVLDVPAVATEVALRRVMSNSFGFGGCNASLILEAAP